MSYPGNVNVGNTAILPGKNTCTSIRIGFNINGSAESKNSKRRLRMFKKKKDIFPMSKNGL
jgi:hypothetical protein